jgi:response regulator RpfG family c-di-GMP phosphodiesterase
LDKQKVDLILIPAMMEGIDAFQACMRSKNSASEIIQNTPVIVIDYFDNEKQNRILNRVGADHIISSDIDAEGLLTSISSILAKTTSQKSHPSDQTKIKPSNSESGWQIIFEEAHGNTVRFEERIWMYRSDMITLLGALKIHLTLLDYSQIEINSIKLDNILEQLQAHKWRTCLDEFRSLNRAETGVQRMRQLYRQMLDEYQKLDKSLEQFLLKIKNNPRG